jgi:predicted DNA-binding transcriptional regulator YafY
MSRASRLLELIEVLRRHRRPVTGARLAEELGISIRTLYRDIATLQAQGADIQGEPGLGYVLRPGFLLPPLMLSVDEIEALSLGARWVADRGDERLVRGAQSALAKLRVVLPADIADSFETSGLLAVAPFHAPEVGIDLTEVRHAIRAEHKLTIAYAASTERTIWPFALAFFDHVRIIAAWCELRADFRSFRADRIRRLAVTDARYPRRRHALLAEWRVRERILERNVD